MKKTILLLVFLYAFPGFTQDDTTIRQKHFNTEKHIALQGYDALGYFKHALSKGLPAFQYSYKGIVYYFASAANLSAFKANPARYEPAYGGWCAYAMGSSGEKVEVDPATYKIINGTLYLFYNKYFNNTLTDWNKDEVHLLKKADTNWANILAH